MRYIALLRGVNVGGNNIISMPQLREAFTQHGFTAVASYINSGNILFSSDSSDIGALRLTCAKLIKGGFGLDITTAVIAAPDLLEAVRHAPAWWNADKEIKHNAMFVIPPFTAPQVCALVGEPKPEYEQIAYHGQVIFWSAPLKTFSRTSWSKISYTAAYGNITIRNANTTLKLAELVKE